MVKRLERLRYKIAPRPILFITSDNDRLVPPAESEALYARAGEPKKLVMLNSYRHYEVYEGETSREVMAATTGWYARYIPAKSIQEQITDDLTRRYGTADYVFCGYGTASHFPNCFRIPGKDDYATAARRQGHFSAAWASIVAKLQPRFAFPFAADVAILDHDLLWTNEQSAT